MVFKQGVLKEEKIKLIIVSICIFVPLIALIVLAVLEGANLEMLLVFVVLFCFPIFLLMLFCGLKNLEWYHIYDDRIEVRGVFGRKNVVYYNNVLFVEETKIKLTARGMEKQFYIFNDGRKNNNNIFDINSCYNKKTLNLRIYKTPKLENYVVQTLCLKLSEE